MKVVRPRSVLSPIILIVLLGSCIAASAQSSAGRASDTLPSAKSGITRPSATSGPPIIQPEELVSSLRLTKGSRPLIIQVGFRVLYVQAHILGSEYVGPASSADGIRQLRNRVESLPRTQSIVLYCGCCPWDRCPNVNPAYKELSAMGFNNVKVLYIANNFGTDWVDKGYPVAKGE